jgi:hypothetical protein
VANREFLMKAQTQISTSKGGEKFDVRGWYASEKMDGVRAFWDGGISRGVLKSLIPWANNKSKDDRFVVKPVSSGLWSSYGNPIYAPDWFLDSLPKSPLDGELWAGRGLFQKTTSIVSKLAGGDWDQITFNCFDAPPYPMVFQTGRINNPNFEKEMDVNESMDFVRRVIPDYVARFYNFIQAQELMLSFGESESYRVVKQHQLTNPSMIEGFLLGIIDQGGEGVIFRKPTSYWEPKRSQQLVKLKPFNDAEGIVTGYTWGKETDKGSKLLGLMGNLILDYNGNRLELSGFTDAERKMSYLPWAAVSDKPMTSDNMSLGAREGELFPGKEISRDWTNQLFPIGSLVTFRYRELSNDGIPKEARYLRPRHGHA